MAVAPDQAPRIGPGTIVYIASDKDYAYGVGPLALRISALEAPTGPATADQWITVKGQRIGADGRLYLREIRVAIKRGALLASVKRPGFVPPATRS